MVTEQIETPSQRRFVIFCLIAAIGSLVVVVMAGVDAWLLFPIAIVLLAALTFFDGYWQTAS